MPTDGSGFPHLAIPQITDMPTERRGGPSGRQPRTIQNLANRSSHAQLLQRAIQGLTTNHGLVTTQRRSSQLPDLPEAIPLWLAVDPDAYDPDMLSAFDIEVLVEENDGIVIGASSDITLQTFVRKVQAFLDTTRTANGKPRRNGSPANIWDIQGGIGWREDILLSPQLKEKWPCLDDATIYTVDVTIAVKGATTVPREKQREDCKDQRSYERAHRRFEDAYSKWDDRISERQDDFLSYLQGLGGECVVGPYTDRPDQETLVDCFGVRLRLSGAGLKDLLYYYPYLASIDEPDEVESPTDGQADGVPDAPFELLPPDEDSPRVCVVDSGVQQGHRFLAPALENAASRSFVPDSPSVADLFLPSGHGTRVAGAILYPREIPTGGEQQSDFWIQNARVLNEHCKLHGDLFPPKLIREVVEHYHRTYGTRVFNHSISAITPHRLGRMSAWAAAIDHLCCENDILFVGAAGNIHATSTTPTSVSIRDLLANHSYPDYLLEPTCRIANPGQSLQTLTVGSIGIDLFSDPDWESFSKAGEPSSFSRTGMGLWGAIKPEVVEYGGDWVRSRRGSPVLFAKKLPSSCELLRLTTNGGSAFLRDGVGTSFAAPKVSRIAARLQQAYPQYSALLYRALIVQSARWPDWAVQRPAGEVLRFIGYGVPDEIRATANSEHRVTLTTGGNVSIRPKQMHVYQIPIPEEIRRQGETHKVRVEVCLSYRSRPHRLRRTTRRYLSTWLDWTTNSTDEPAEEFVDRIKRLPDQRNSFKWTIGRHVDQGIEGVRLSDSTVQKDWAVVDCFDLPETLCVAVVGHKVPQKKEIDEPAEYALAVSFESEGSQVEIYEPIRNAVQTLLQTRASVETQIEVER